MKRHLPFALTTLRLLLGPIALACALAGVTRFVYLPILITATLSDIFDGVLARKFGVATPALRRYDSITDIIYYLFILAVAWLLCKPVIAGNLWLIALILLSEAAVHFHLPRPVRQISGDALVSGEILRPVPARRLYRPARLQCRNLGHRRVGRRCIGCKHGNPRHASHRQNPAGGRAVDLCAGETHQFKVGTTCRSSGCAAAQPHQ